MSISPDEPSGKSFGRPSPVPRHNPGPEVSVTTRVMGNRSPGDLVSPRLPNRTRTTGGGTHGTSPTPLTSSSFSTHHGRRIFVGTETMGTLPLYHYDSPTCLREDSEFAVPVSGSRVKSGYRSRCCDFRFSGSWNDTSRQNLSDRSCSFCQVSGDLSRVYETSPVP